MLSSGGASLGGSDPLLSRQMANTGLLEGGEINQVFTSTTLNISSGSGYVVDYTDPTNPTVKKVTFAAQPTYTVQNIGGIGLFIVGIDSSGSTVEIASADVTAFTRNDFILIGSYAVDSGSIIAVAEEPLNLGYDGVTTSHEAIRNVIGPANVTGNIISNNGTDLKLQNSGGDIFIISGNFRNSTKSPDQITIAAASPMSFFRTLREVGGSNDIVSDGDGLVDVIDPTRWDNNGVLTTVPSNDFTVQVVYITSGGAYTVNYGQETFNTLVNAQTAIQTGTLQYEERPTNERLVRRLFLIVRESTTDLSNVAAADFVNDGRFRLSGVIINT